MLGIGDEAAGVSLALGICAALYARATTGEGTKIEISMQEAMLGFMVSTLHTLFEGQPVGGRYFECADGYVSFHLPDMRDELWTSLATALGHEDAVTDPRFVDRATRRRHFPQVQEKVAEMVRGHTRAELWEIFKQYGIASSPVRSIAEVVDNEHIKARGAFVEVEHPAGRDAEAAAPVDPVQRDADRASTMPVRRSASTMPRSTRSFSASMATGSSG